MSVKGIIRRVCEPCRGLVHRTRAQCVEDAVEAIARGGRLSAACIGRSLRSATTPKHGIKRVDRLLGNTKLHKHRWRYYEAIAQQVLGSIACPLVIVDWSGTVKGMHTLAAATPIGGRAVTLYAEVWPESKYANRIVQQRFLLTLQRVLGEHRRPIIVADAGFRAPFMHAVKQLGWDYVVRIRGPVHVRSDDSSPWIKSTAFHAAATTIPTSLGIYRITRERSSFTTPTVDARLILSRKARPRVCRRTSRAPVTGMHGGRGILAAAKEPWLLATSLSVPANFVVKIYETRMQIEETFRDHKSHRLGWCLRHVRSRCRQRLTTLLMLAALAMLAVTLVGIAAERLKLHRAYQANTCRRRVLSFFSLGRALIARNDDRLLAAHTLRHIIPILQPSPDFA